MLAYQDLGLIQGSGWLFRHLDLHLAPRDRLALIGRNGAGKTTLLRLLAGQVEADEGRRTIVPGTRVVLLEQEPTMAGCETLREFALGGPDAPAAHEVDAIAGQLGIDLSREAAPASGGERRRAAIARALAQAPDVLLLDEPTNHLDLAAIEWLEGWLGRFAGAFVVISHDRTFLTRLTRSTLWLDRAWPPPAPARGGAQRRETRRQAQAGAALAATRRHRPAQAQPGPPGQAPRHARDAGGNARAARHGQAGGRRCGHPNEDRDRRRACHQAL